MKVGVCRILFAVVFLLICETAILAQTETASLSGRITDPRGLVVPKATVEAIENDTGTKTTTQSNDEGLYYLPSLRPGSYRVDVTKDGFKQIVQAGVLLHIQDVLTLNFALQIGSRSETVTVSAGSPRMDTQDATVSTVVTREQLENMPLNGRSLQSLITLVPGVVLTPVNGGNGFVNESNSGQFSTDGQRTYSNYFTVDGVSANTSADGSPSSFSGGQATLTVAGTTQSLVSVDDLQEFRIQTSSYAPEFGRSPGAQIELLTRGGTNAYHGSLFEYLRNNDFDAQDWFAKAFGQTSPELRQNDFGGTLGGPVRLPGYNGHDRTFFFFSYEGLRLRQPSFNLADVPSNEIRQSTVPAIQPFLDAFPLPTLINGSELITDPLGLARYIDSHSDPSTINSWSLRGDHTFNERLNMFIRYSNSNSNGTSRDLANLTSIVSNSQQVTLGLTATLNSGMVNEFRGNFSRSTSHDVDTLDSFGGATPPPASLLFPAGLATPNDSLLFLNLQFTIGAPTFFVGTPAANIQRQINLVDFLSFTKGTHAMKFGVDYRRLFPTVGPSAYNQSLTFEAAPSPFASLGFGDPNDDLTAGTVEFAGVTSQLSNLKPVFINLSLYAQDTWRISRHLTLTYGLRWEFNPTPHNSNGPDPAVLTGLGNPATFALAPPGTPLYPTRYNDFAPRLGVAYQLGQRPGWETVLRGGTGLFYDLGSTEVTSAFNGFPLQAQSFLESLPGAVVNYPLTPSELAPPPTIASDGSFTVYDGANFNLPRTFQWNFAVEQGLGDAQTFTATYVGNFGRKLLRLDDFLSPNPTLANASVSIYRSDATSDYDALQLQYQRRMSHGFQVLGSYTWSHALDDVSDDGQGFSLFARGNSNFDIRQNFAVSASYEVPTPSINKFGRALLRGWGLDMIAHAQSGAPIDLQAGFLLFPNGSDVVIRPDVVPGVPIYQSGQVCPGLLNPTILGPCPGGRRINPAAFKPPPADPITGQFLRQGDLGRNQLRGLPLTQVDFAVRRQFNLTEKIHLQFRAEAFNLANHPNFGGINNLLNTPYFGEPQSMLGAALGGVSSLYQIGGPRSLQLALKLAF